ncbi:hypothetical protein F5Y16DRAFT_396857 [Xylariaceae sp. FL0255]|nr:hypothetical protein F5Y16DRAFT_396857 [Xylariaceae sp. FL0255]
MSPSKRKASEATESPETGKSLNKKPKQKKAVQSAEEKRLRRFRPKAPQAFDIVYERATSQRLVSILAPFYVLKRTRRGTEEYPEEMVEMTGSTGNIYNVLIARIPTCDCPHAIKGNQCKHVLYVMSRVLRAPYNLVYQLALLSSELREIFQNAPPIPGEADADGESRDGKRKPIEGDCPICFTAFEDTDATVYCRATCGQNFHKECFEMWAATKNRAAHDSVTCPICRSHWQGDEDMVSKIKKKGKMGRDGYVNVADQLGISRTRDTSTYHRSPWAVYHDF